MIFFAHAYWALEEQLHEDWKEQITKICVTLLNSHGDRLVTCPSGNKLVYSLRLIGSEPHWVSRSYEEFQKEEVSI